LTETRFKAFHPDSNITIQLPPLVVVNDSLGKRKNLNKDKKKPYTKTLNKALNKKNPKQNPKIFLDFALLIMIVPPPNPHNKP
jgi:hypothetical protein